MPRIGDPEYRNAADGIQRITRRYSDGRAVVTHKINYSDEKGKTVFRVVQSHRLADAKQARAEALVAVQQRKHVSHRSSRTPFKVVADEWFEVKEPDWKQRTAGSVRWTIDSKLAPLHEIRIGDLDYSRVSTFRSKDLKKKNGDKSAPSSVRRSMWVLNAICEYARKRKMIVENPCADLDRIKGRKPPVKMPTTEDVERLIARLSESIPERLDSKGRTLKARQADPRWALLVETAAYTGLRAGELAGLQVRDLNFHTRSLRVERTVVAVYGEGEPESGLRLDTPKSEAGVRTVDNLDADLMDRLKVHTRGLSPRDFVFGNRDADGKPRPMHHGNTYRRVIKPAADELGIDMTFHGLRHHAGSLWLDLGMTIVEVAARLGHSSAAFTLRTYAHELKVATTDYGDEVRKRRAAARGDEPAKVIRMRSRRPF